VWTLITEITATCSGGVSANFMLDAWRVVSKQLRDNRAPAEAAQAVGLQHEAAAVLRAIAASESVLDDATVSPRPGVLHACLIVWLIATLCSSFGSCLSSHTRCLASRKADKVKRHPSSSAERLCRSRQPNKQAQRSPKIASEVVCLLTA
jgi:hypothetical protein